MRIAAGALALITLFAAGCGREPFRAELRIDNAPQRVLVATPRFALVDDARVSTMPRPIRDEQAEALESGFIAAVEARGFVHDPDDPQLLVVLYRERGEARRGDPYPVRVDWRYGERAGTYRYDLQRRSYPDFRVGILVCDVIDAADGRLLRQLIDPDFFTMAKLEAKEEPEAIPASYAFPVGVLAARSSAGYHGVQQAEPGE